MMSGRSSELIVVLAVVAATGLSAQQTPPPARPNSRWAPEAQIGGTIGLGSFGSTEYTSGGFVVAGVEGCALCGGKFGLFMEYDHWRLAPTGFETSVLNLGAGGLRIQGRGRRVRPFFDIGGALGRYNGKPHGYIHRSEDFSMVGVMIGTGAAISIGEKWYVRPQARLALMRSGNLAGFLSVGVGYRF
jgi:hypothetical protein